MDLIRKYKQVFTYSVFQEFNINTKDKKFC